MLRRAADEFVTAIAMFHEPGGAKPCDGGGLKVKREEREPAGSFYFHAVSMTGLVGHLLSKPKIKIRGGGSAAEARTGKFSGEIARRIC